MTRRMYRYEISPFGQARAVELTGNPVAAAALAYGGMEFWAEHDDRAQPVLRRFAVLGTGHEVPDGAEHVAMAPRTPEGFVWHLFELAAEADHG